MKRVNGAASADSNGPHTLAIDIGGTRVKAFVRDSTGRMIMMRRLTDASTFSNDGGGCAGAVERLILPRGGNGSAVA